MWGGNVMICRNCSFNFEDGMMYCPNCGTPVYDNGNQQYYNQTQQNEPYTMPNYNMNNFQQQNVNKTPTVWQYLGWMIIGSCFGPISIIISIIFACMKENKTRANFFKAHLIIFVIAFLLVIILGIIVLVAFGVGGSILNDNIYSYNSDIFDGMLKIISLL